MIALLAALAWAQASASHTITFRIIGLPPDPPALEQRDGGHWLLTLAEEGTYCAPRRVGCWSVEWVPDAPPEEEPTCPTS